MFNRLKVHLLSRPVAFHPVLFAAFPILFLYVHNIEGTRADMMIVPTVVSIAGAFIIWILLDLLLKDLRKAALAATLFIIIFLSYGRIYAVLQRWNIFVPGHAHLISLLLFIWGYIVYFIKVTRHEFKPVTVMLNIAAVVLIIINLFNIGWYAVSGPQSAKMDTRQNEIYSENVTDGVSTPDIYYIILDEYAHPDTMAKLYNYDNADLVKNLTRKGFYIATGSKTTSVLSEVSIAQSLNMEYLDPSATRAAGLEHIQNSNVVSYLRSRGYHYIYIGPYNVRADEYYNFSEYSKSGFQVSEFNGILINTTMLSPFYYNVDKRGYDNPYRQEIIKSLNQLKMSVAIKGTKFVCMHVICPHAYFVFGPNGEYVSPDNWQNSKDKQYYLGQYIFISRQINEVVEFLLKSSFRSPVIIIQSDHGLREQPGGGEFIQGDWRKILNAYYLPGNGKELLYSSISPVNSFRLIFNYYFGEKMEFLPDE